MFLSIAMSFITFLKRCSLTHFYHFTFVSRRNKTFPSAGVSHFLTSN